MITVLSHVNFMSLSVILHILILGLSLLNMTKKTYVSNRMINMLI